MDCFFLKECVIVYFSFLRNVCHFLRRNLVRKVVENSDQ